MRSPGRPPLRVGLAQSRKAAYDAYMSSPAWFEQRRQWQAEELRRTGTPIVCAVCGQAWTLRDDLHHVDYSNLRAERHEDLVPVDRDCHDQIHALVSSLRLLRSLPSRLANETAIDRLRASRLSGSN